MDTFADMIQSTAKELESSIFTDERLEKKIGAALRKKGIRMLYTNFFMTQAGRYEIQVTARTMKNQKISTKEIAKAVSDAAGRRLILQSGTAQVIGETLYDGGMSGGAGLLYYAGGGAYREKDAARYPAIILPCWNCREEGRGRRFQMGMGSGEEACRRAPWSLN